MNSIQKHSHNLIRCFPVQVERHRKPMHVDADDVGDYPGDLALIAHDEQKLDL